MQLEQKVNFHNRFDIEVNGELVGFAENIVLDQMWTRLCAGSTYFANIHFGTGSGTPVASRTSLFTHLGTKAAVDVEKIRTLPVSTVKRKITINPEEHIGAVLKEVGIAYGATNTNLVTHAMIKDAEGNPLSITKGATDVIIIYATVYITLVLPTGVTLSPVEYISSSNLLLNWLLNNSSAPTGVIRLYDSKIGQLLGSSSTLTWTSDIPNKKRIGNPVRFDIYTGNGNIKMVAMDNLFSMELPAASIFNGQSYSGIPVGTYIGTSLKFRLPSANIKDETLVVKINGVVTTDYIIEHPYALAMIPDALSTSARYHDANFNYDGSVLAIATDGGGLLLEAICGDIIIQYSLASGSTTYDVDYANGRFYARYTNQVFYMNAPRGGMSPVPTVLTKSSIIGTLINMKISKDGTTMLLTGGSPPYIDILDITTDTLLSLPVPIVSSYTPSVAINDDGSVVVINTDVFNKINNVWTKRPTLPIDINQNGDNKIVLKDNGNTLYMTAQTAPGIFKFTWDGINWTYHDLGIVQTNCYDVDVDDAQETLLLGTYGIKGYRLFKFINNVWEEIIDTYTWPALFRGYDVALSGDGSQLFVGTSVATPNPNAIRQRIHQDNTDIIFNNLTVGDVITADYTVKGIHKTDQYVVDVGVTFQFGEGV